MSYEFETLYSTGITFNCDVKKSRDNQYMGRLYTFSTEDSNLLKLGIEKEWFLVHELGEFLICGHINTEGGWSLSDYKSLEPSLAYKTQSEIFDYVFSTEYMREKLSHSEVALNLSEYLPKNDSFGSGEDDSSDKSKPGIFDPYILTDFSASIVNLDILKDLLMRSHLEDLQELQFTDVQQNDTLSFEQQTESLALVSPSESLISLREVSTSSEKIDLLEIQEFLIGKVMEDYSKEISEFILPPFGIVTIHVEEDYFVLSSSEDGHTILAATISGEVLDELKEADGLKFIDVLHSSEIEVSRYFENTSQQLDEVETIQTQTQIDQQKGIDYGA